MCNRGRFLSSVLILSLGSVLVGGCGTPQREVPKEELHMSSLARAYGFYQQQHRGETPPNKEAFSKFLKGLSAEQREGRGIKGDVDQLFISPRDKQPYVILYNVKSSGVPNPASEEADVIAYEKTGSGGSHFVAFSTGKVSEVEEARLKKMLSRQK
jgi:hypothetical protein